MKSDYIPSLASPPCRRRPAGSSFRRHGTPTAPSTSSSASTSFIPSRSSSLSSSFNSSSSTTITARRRAFIFAAVLMDFFLLPPTPRFAIEVAAFTTTATRSSYRTRSAASSFCINDTSNIRPGKLDPLLMVASSSRAALDKGRNNSSNNNDNRNKHSSRSSSTNSKNNQGFSRSFQSILSRTNNDRQRFVTGQYPVIITMEENPTLKWLQRGKSMGSGSGGGGVGSSNNGVSTTLLLVNGTTIDRSLASYDRYQWLEETERRELHDRYATVSMELLAEIHVPKPGYLQILSGDGAGSSAALSRITSSSASDAPIKRWNRWRRDATLLYHREIETLELQEAPLRDRLWVTGFSLAGRRGFINSVDIHDGYINSVNPRSKSMILWPNEVNRIPTDMVLAPPGSVKEEEQQKRLRELTQDALLVSDGFLVPGKDRGGIYVIKNPGHESAEWSICLTKSPISNADQWFYHRAVWVDLTGDGRQSILTARAKLKKAASSTSGKIQQQPQKRSTISVDGDFLVDRSRPKNGQLVWLEMPKPHHFDEATGTPLEEDGTAFDPFSGQHLPWKERILATGPDVMFAVADLDTQDDTIEVLASQFFEKRVTLHSIQRGPNPRIALSRVIDDRCGAAFGGVLANLDPKTNRDHRVIDAGSTVGLLGRDDSFSHFLVTSHECDYDVEKGPDGSFRQANTEMYSNNNSVATSNEKQATLRGGSLFAYKVPEGKDAWKSASWSRTTVASGFRVKSQIWNVINPGAPGFCYTFHAHKDDESKGKRPMIAVAGDCAESAYIFRPQRRVADPDTAYLEKCADVDPHAQYKLMCEVQCGATVGSITIGYGDLCSAEQESGYAKIYIPCFEKDKILVFALGSGEEAENGDGW